MSRRRLPAWLLATAAVTVLVSSAADASAQTSSQSLTDALSFLLTNQSVPTGDFTKDAEAARVTRETITRSLLVELSTLPISSSSPGFVYRLNHDLGTVERASETFGAFFAERSLTAGRGQASFGINLRLSSFDRLDGHDLGDGSFVTSGNRFRDQAAPFDVDRLTLELDARTVSAFATVGVTDRLDVGVAIPFVSLSLKGSRVNTYYGQVLQQARADAHATGFGDVAVRGKYRVVDAPGVGGVAVVGEVRLPTGDRENLLGAGKSSLRVLGIGSVESGRFGMHVNGGFTVGGLSNEFQYRSAASFSAAPRLTLVGELLGHRLSDVGRVTEAQAPHPSFLGVDTIRLVTVGSSTHTASALAGAKWNVTGTWLVSGSLSWPLLDRGLRAGTVVQIGLDYALPQ